MGLDAGQASQSAATDLTVLVIEDEPLVQMLVLDALEELGHRALEAYDGPSGLRVLESEQHIDLLISDIRLPGGMSGHQIADAARVLRPDLKVLLMTGYAEGVSGDMLKPGMGLIAKPFLMDAFMQKIEELLDR